jgi:hypothetical protein
MYKVKVGGVDGIDMYGTMLRREDHFVGVDLFHDVDYIFTRCQQGIFHRQSVITRRILSCEQTSQRARVVMAVRSHVNAHPRIGARVFILE